MHQHSMIELWAVNRSGASMLGSDALLAQTLALLSREDKEYLPIVYLGLGLSPQGSVM